MAKIRKGDIESEHKETTGVEKVYWRHWSSVCGTQTRRYRTFLWESQFLPPYYQACHWSITNRNNIFGPNILQGLHLKKILETSKHALSKETTRRKCGRKKSSRKLIMTMGKPLWHRGRERTRSFYPSSHNIHGHYHVSNVWKTY